MPQKASNGRCRSQGEQPKTERRRATSQDKDALFAEAESLVQREVSLAMSRIPRDARTRELTDDLVAAGHEGVARATEGYDPRRGPFPAYAAEFVRGRIADELRRQTEWAKYTEEFPGDDEVTTKLPSVDDYAPKIIDDIHGEALLERWLSLPGKYGAAVRLRHQGVSRKAIAEHVRVSERTVSRYEVPSEGV